MKHDRLEQIKNYIEEHGNVATIELTKHFGVSEMTIRRDLITLEQQGSILRFHGGAAIQKSDKAEAAFDIRVNTNQQQKKIIGAAGIRYLRKHLPQHSSNSVFFGSGSTIYLMAMQMTSVLDVPIITDNTYVAGILTAIPGNSVIMIGGQLILPSLNATGYIAEKMISDFTIDYSFISSSAIDEDGNLYAFNLLEAGVFSTVIAASRHVVILVDSSKLGMKNLIQLGPLDNHFTLITDDGISQESLRCYERLGTEVMIAETAEQR